MSDILGYFRQKINSPAFIHAIANATVDVGYGSHEENEALGDFDNFKLRERILDWLSAQFVAFYKDPAKVHDGIYIYDGLSVRGFKIEPGYAPFNQHELMLLFTYLRDRVLLLPYYVHSSDTRILHRTEWIETIYRFALQPDYMLDARGCRVQQFGNITIEAVMKNSKLVNLKFNVVMHQGHDYTKPQPLDELFCVITGR